MLDAYDAVACLDLSVGHSPEAYARLGEQLERSAPGIGPFLAWSPGWGSVDCAYWPVPPQRDPEPIDAAGVPPILVIGGTHDPATPYPWAEALAEQLPSSVLLTRDGDGHGSYSRSECINAHTDAYLIGLDLPPDGTVCR
jgi:pimeloyl-ACP methyl ester carboxylesterase